MPKSWMRLDNAGTIYPAAKRRGWTALFRLSATLKETVDPEILQQALNNTAPRFPAFSSRLEHGVFWYYFERTPDVPTVQEDVGNPCVCMDLHENDRFSFRVRYYENRIAVEIFHVLTDGTGGLSFLKTLTAEYLRLKYGVEIPCADGILDCAQKPQMAEVEDGFFKNVGDFTMSRSEPNSYHIKGTPDTDNLVNIITGCIPSDVLLSAAKKYNASLTEFITAVAILSVDTLQRREVKRIRALKPVKINVPVNLRRIFPSKTLRNFASYVNPGIDPRLGNYTLEEVIKIVHHTMGLEITEKALTAKFTTNVRNANNAVLRVVPLFMKNFVMRMVFMAVGDKKTATCLSNLGNVQLPDEMTPYVERIEFILGPLSINKVAVAALSYNGTFFINFTRTIRETEFEREFFTRLVRLGIPVKIESNQRW